MQRLVVAPVAVCFYHFGVRTRSTTDATLPEVRIIALLASDVAGRHPLGAGPGLDVGLSVHKVDILEG